uniref:Uncharacterized protein n=1 Tax=Arundo donax TaxID=35708 RepID=A0A0A9H4Y0_ARUDO
MPPHWTGTALAPSVPPAAARSASKLASPSPPRPSAPPPCLASRRSASSSSLRPEHRRRARYPLRVERAAVSRIASRHRVALAPSAPPAATHSASELAVRPHCAGNAGRAHAPPHPSPPISPPDLPLPLPHHATHPPQLSISSLLSTTHLQPPLLRCHLKPPHEAAAPRATATTPRLQVKPSLLPTGAPLGSACTSISGRFPARIRGHILLRPPRGGDPPPLATSSKHGSAATSSVGCLLEQIRCQILSGFQV